MKALIDTCIIIDVLQKREPFYYEDAVMVQTAIRISADCIVTRNIKDYKHSFIPIFSPEEFLRLPFHQL